MQKTFDSEDIEQMLAEADELLQQIDPEIIDYLEDENRAQLEQQAESLKNLKIQLQDQIGKEGAPETGPYSEGVHEAIENIVKAMKGLAGFLS